MTPLKRTHALIGIAVLIFVAVAVPSVSAQDPLSLPTFQRFTAEDGLAQNTIFCLLQDSKGFLWIGTYHGLSRFDGYQFVNYRHDFQDQHSISDNKVTSIIETRSGEIWLGTRNGLNRYDQATNKFESYKFDADNPNLIGDSYIEAVFEDRSGTLWLGTNRFGLSKFDKATGRFTNYGNEPDNSESLSHNYVFDIGEDAGGGLWIATSGGLNKFDRETGRFTRYKSNKKDPNSLSDNRIRSMLIDRAGIIWLGTENGLNKFDPNSNQFTRYTADINKPHSINDNAVRAIYETKAGTIWVGTQNGLNRYLKETDGFLVYKYDPSNPRSLGEGEISAIVEDNMEQLWVGSSVGGLSKYNQKKARFRQFKHDDNNPNTISNDNIWSMFEDKNEVLWIGTLGGLSTYSFKQNRFEIHKEIPDNTTSFYQDREGKIWFGTAKGLFYFDPDTKRVTTYEDPSNDPAFKSVIAIREDPAGDFWIGTRNGQLRQFDYASHKFTRLQNDPNNLGGAGKEVFLAIFKDSLGEIWIGTRSSLTRFNLATRSFKQYKHDQNNPTSLSASDVGAIYEDKSGTLWFGTSSGGLNRFDRQTETFTHFTEREGLPINNVYEILEDEQGNLWLSTDKGLARFNIATKRFRNFDVDDGLTNNEFNDRSAFKNKNGEMYFGGPDGFVKFNPREFTDSNFKPPIYLTDIRILEQPLKTKDNITELRDLSLSWRDYIVSFEFAALDSTDPKKLQYQWKLEGFDTDWINGGTRRTATYTNLPGGHYVLKVKATNVDGLWTPESVILQINVTPPFYRTLWFFAIVGLAAGLMVWLLYRYRINQLRVVNEAQTRFAQQLITSQEAERKRIAAELHDGLGQSLVIIKNRAMLGLNKGDDKERVVRELNSISDAASQALEEVREVTNNLRPQMLDRLGLTKALRAMLNKVSGVIEIESDIDPIDGIFSENEEISIYRIAQESVNNIVKHSNASGASVTIKRETKEVLIKIEDNGRGFDAKAEAKPFSLGLVGLKERSNLLGAEIKIDSSPGKGTRIEVRIPVRS